LGGALAGLVSAFNAALLLSELPVVMVAIVCLGLTFRVSEYTEINRQ
jgi:hypothetical protein